MVRQSNCTSMSAICVTEWSSVSMFPNLPETQQESEQGWIWNVCHSWKERMRQLQKDTIIYHTLNLPALTKFGVRQFLFVLAIDKQKAYYERFRYHKMKNHPSFANPTEYVRVEQ